MGIEFMEYKSAPYICSQCSFQFKSRTCRQTTLKKDTHVCIICTMHGHDNIMHSIFRPFRLKTQFSLNSYQSHVQAHTPTILLNEFVVKSTADIFLSSKKSQIGPSYLYTGRYQIGLLFFLMAHICFYDVSN